jgi:predicted helicase
LDIRVIVGNPPYSVGQTSGNDNNANLKYPTLDESIRDTYADRSSSTLQRNLYDSYIRSIRWASNRVLNQDHGGVVCYVSNGGYIDGNYADGLRKTLTRDFHEVYVYNLRGNQRTAGEQSRKEGGKIFDSGSRATVAILLLVKRPGPVTECRLRYKDIGDYLDRNTKLSLVDEASLDSLDWEIITPNESGDWINQRDPNYDRYPALFDRSDKSGRHLFNTISTGIATSRDAWAYNSSSRLALSNIKRMLDTYNDALARWTEGGRPEPMDREVTSDPTQISWSRGLKNHFSKERKIDPFLIQNRRVLYRPFNVTNLAFGKEVLSHFSAIDRFFPTADTENFGFYLTSPSTHFPTFALLATDAIPDLHMLDTGQFFARYSYIDTSATSEAEGLDAGREAEDGTQSLFGTSGMENAVPGEPKYERVDNITDWALGEYRSTYGEDVSKDDVFFYVYGLLHSPEYRTRYASDLKKQLPRIPQVPGRQHFDAFVAAGRELSALHIGYESLEPYPLEESVLPGAPADEYERFAVTKMKYAGKSGAWDKTTLKYNRWITLSGLPEAAQEYLLGSRSGVDWLVERYQVKTDKKSGIVNDPNDWSREHGQPRYIIDLIGRVVALSLSTQQIVNGLPELDV